MKKKTWNQESLEYLMTDRCLGDSSRQCHALLTFLEIFARLELHVHNV